MTHETDTRRELDIPKYTFRTDIKCDAVWGADAHHVLVLSTPSRTPARYARGTGELERAAGMIE